MAERYPGGTAVRESRPGESRPLRDQSTAELVQHASEQISRLVRDEIELARAELRDKGRHAGMGAGLFGAGGLVALYGVGALVLAVIFLLALVMPDWVAALIVGVVLLALAGGLALAGRGQVRRAVPPTPERAVRSVREDLDTVTAAVRTRRRP
ncbi:MAG: phage holin family protein [Micromonosporaceae bacterium]|jgi:hypothetical protein